MSRKFSSLYLYFSFCVALLALCGCSTQFTNADKINELRVGMTKEQVLRIMGSPLSDEKYNTPDTWFYYYSTKWYDGLSTEDECYPLVFKDNTLIGFGYDFYMNQKIFNLKEKTDKIKADKKAIIDTIPTPENPKILNSETPGVAVNEDAYVIPTPAELPPYTPPAQVHSRQGATDNAQRSQGATESKEAKKIDIKDYDADDDVNDAELPIK